VTARSVAVAKRLIFIQNTRTIPDKTGSVIGIRASSLSVPDLIIPGNQKVQMYSFPLLLETHGPRDFHLSFRATRELTDAGVMLVGAYHEDDSVRAAFINFGNDLRLKEKQVILEVALTEEVRFFQSDLNAMNRPSSPTAATTTSPKTSRKKRQ
jgi:hypothetical protein